jgi:hypothetical protein
MKKLLLVLLSITLLTSCHEEGEVVQSPNSVYTINGKNYKFIQIAPAENGHPVWIMVPLDTLQVVPQVIVTEQSNGKTTSMESTIILN